MNYVTRYTVASLVGEVMSDEKIKSVRIECEDEIKKRIGEFFKEELGKELAKLSTNFFIEEHALNLIVYNEIHLEQIKLHYVQKVREQVRGELKTHFASNISLSANDNVKDVISSEILDNTVNELTHRVANSLYKEWKVEKMINGVIYSYTRELIKRNI